MSESHRPAATRRAPATRRHLLKLSGTTLVGITFLSGCQSTTGMFPAIRPAAGVVGNREDFRPTPVAPRSPALALAVTDEKPTYVAQTYDPVAYSVADNMFWNDILMEHALFFVMLMPGEDLAVQRKQAEDFRRTFERQLEQSKSIDASNYVAFNRSTIDHAKRFSEYKKTMEADQARGRMHSLVWPLFFQHTAREADRFSGRLEMYNRGNIEFDRREVVDFWSKTMSEHAAFIAHLLDPTENMLIGQATTLEKAFERPSDLRAPSGDPVLAAAREILDFKTVGEKGIKSGMIKSIIPPNLADHVRREAVKFIDELERVNARNRPV